MGNFNFHLTPILLGEPSTEVLDPVSIVPGIFKANSLPPTPVTLQTVPLSDVT